MSMLALEHMLQVFCISVHFPAGILGESGLGVQRQNIRGPTVQIRLGGGLSCKNVLMTNVKKGNTGDSGRNDK